VGGITLTSKEKERKRNMEACAKFLPVGKLKLTLFKS
jgi:hypothetical protein